MLGTVFDWVNVLGTDQKKLLVFTDSKERIIGDGAYNLTGAGGDGDNFEAPLNIENENYFDYQEDQE